MSALSRLRSWWRARRDPAGLNRQLREELEFHVERAAEDLVREGLSPDVARQRARAALGSVPAAQEDVRAALGLRLGDEVRGDLRCGSDEPDSLGCAAGFQETRDVGKRVPRRPHDWRLAVRVLR